MQHEQSFADTFRSFMENRASKYGCRFHVFSLDGQDRDIGADYLLTDADRFAIIEFKYTERNLASEKFKPRRLALCQMLAKHDEMRGLHDQCHFISWSEGPEIRVMTNTYRREICTQAVFGALCGLSDRTPERNTRLLAGEFADKFFSSDGSSSLSLVDFDRYLERVLKVSEPTRATLELVAHNPDSHDLTLVRLNSIAEAQQWVKDHIAPPPPTSRPRQRGPG